MLDARHRLPHKTLLAQGRRVPRKVRDDERVRRREALAQLRDRRPQQRRAPRTEVANDDLAATNPTSAPH
eukprot:3373616-Rhodomonas_salina.1